jgi:hypothetical protein
MPTLPAARLVLSIALACAVLQAQVSVSGRVVDETGATVAGARVELSLPGAPATATSSDATGNFSLSLPAAGEYDIRVERQGFYLYQGKGQHFEEGESHLSVTLNHTQEFSERVDVTYSPPAIDPQQASAHKELDNTEIQAVPYPAPQDYRNALYLMNGVIQDSSGGIHVNGGDSNQTSYSLDGFNISNPVTGTLDARVNIETVQSVNLETSRFSADTGRGSAGALDVQTKMGDDHWRFVGTNFIPGVSSDGGFHVNKWTPRLEVSGPLAKGRAWFHNGVDAFYSNDVIHGLPNGQNRTSGITASDLARFQVNLTSSNIVTASFLANVAEISHDGLTILNPVETTSTQRQLLFVSSVRDQQYFNGALLEAGFSDTRTLLRDIPQGDEVYQITPYGNRGNYFVDLNQHAYRQQWIVNLYLPTIHRLGEHQVKFGIDFEREAFHEKVMRHDYEVLNDDNSVARYVSFQGSPFLARKNFEGAQYVQDHWTPVKGLAFEAGLRAEWNEIVRDILLAPRFGAVWAPSRLRDTKFSAGWGVYYDAISLSLVSSQQDQESLATFYGPGGIPLGPPVETAFHVNEQALKAPRYRTASVGVERKLPFNFYLKTEYTHRGGDRGFTFTPPPGGVPVAPPVNDAASAAPSIAVYDLSNTRRDRYDALDVGVRRTFKGQFEWFAGYTRSSSRTNEAVEYSLQNPIFAPQSPGPFAWDAPNRFHMWGWVPVPSRRFPGFLRFATRNTTAAYLVEYRTGFPYSVVDEGGFQVGPPGSMRYPDYFNINLHFERKFMALHYLWAWRFGFNNLTNNGNFITVNNVEGTPDFRTYGRGQVRAFSVRLRMLGRK